MELYIKATHWQVNRVTGEKKENTAFEGKVPCVLGDISEISDAYRSFSIDRVTENNVTVTVHHALNPDADKTLLIKRGETEIHAPRSFGAGFVYKFKLV